MWDIDEVRARTAKLIAQHGEELARMIDANGFAILDMNLTAPAPKSVPVVVEFPAFAGEIVEPTRMGTWTHVGRTLVDGELFATYTGCRL